MALHTDLVVTINMWPYSSRHRQPTGFAIEREILVVLLFQQFRWRIRAALLLVAWYVTSARAFVLPHELGLLSAVSDVARICSN